MTEPKPLILKLGVLDLPYGKASSYAEAGAKKPHSMAGGDVSTGDVAGFLEDGYGVMEFFWDTNSEQITTWIMESLEGAAESIAMGAPPTHDPYGTATDSIQALFREQLSAKFMDGKVGGVPTMAAQTGHSKRFKRVSKKRPPRPSFIDSGLYQSAMRAWVGDDDDE